MNSFVNKIKSLSLHLLRHEKKLFFIFSLWLCLEYIILGPFSYARVGDNLDSYAPRLTANWNMSISYGITYWQPLFAGGLDRLANSTFYLNFNNLAFLLPSCWLTIGFILLLSSFIGSLYVFLFCKNILQLDQNSSIYAGLICAYSLILTDIPAFMLGLSIFFVALYYLEIFSDRSQFESKNYIKIIFLGIVFALFSSLLLTLPFTLIAIAIWFFLIRKKFSFPCLFILTLFTFPSFILHTQRVWALLLNAPFSQRAGQETSYFNAGFDYYIFRLKILISQNLLPLLITFLGLLFLRIKNRLFTASIILLMILLFIAPLYQPFATLFGHYFKSIRDFDFSRFYLLVPFFASITSAFVVNNISGKIWIGKKISKNSKTYSLQNMAVIFVVLILLISNFSLKWQRFKSWVIQGGYKTYTYSPDIEYIAKDKQAGVLFRMATLTKIANNRIINIPTLPNFHGLESIDGHANMTTRENIDYFKIMSGDPSIKSSLYFTFDNNDDPLAKKAINAINFPLLSLANVKYFISPVKLKHSYLKLVNTPTVSDYKNWQKLDIKTKVLYRLEENFKGRKLLVYENTQAFPRFFLTRKVRVFDNNEAMLSALKVASPSALRTQAFIRHQDNQNTPASLLSGSLEKIELIKYSPDEIQLSTQSDGPSLLVITNNYNQFWKAYVQGEQQKIIPVYHTYMGVFLEKNDNEVVLRYEPPYNLTQKQKSL